MAKKKKALIIGGLALLGLLSISVLASAKSEAEVIEGVNYEIDLPFSGLCKEFIGGDDYDYYLRYNVENIGSEVGAMKIETTFPFNGQEFTTVDQWGSGPAQGTHWSLQTDMFPEPPEYIIIKVYRLVEGAWVKTSQINYLDQGVYHFCG